MENEMNFEELISKYIDNEVSAEEKVLIEQKLRDDKALLQYYRELKKMKGVLKSWEDEDLSPDLERKIAQLLPKASASKEGSKMTFKQMMMASSSLVVVMLVLVLSMQTYVKRGVQGRLKSAADDIGSQLTASNGSPKTQYEPYYLTQNYNIAPRDNSAESSIASFAQVQRIIQKAQLSLEVKSCIETSAKISEIVSAYAGVIVDSQINRSSENYYSGRVIFRLTPQNFDVVLEKVKSLGRVALERVTGEDVSEEYVDLTARLNTNKTVHERLINILQVNSKNVKDILEVEREIARVGQEIERIEGRMKYLDNQVALATITVDYYEPRPVTAPASNIIERFKQTFRKATDVAINTFNAIIVLVSALIPIAIWLGIGWGVFLIIRKFVPKK